MTEMIALQEVWEAAGGVPEIKATKEEVLLVLNLLDQCVDEQDEDIKKLDQENQSLQDILSKLVQQMGRIGVSDVYLKDAKILLYNIKENK